MKKGKGKNTHSKKKMTFKDAIELALRTPRLTRKQIDKVNKANK